MRKVTKIAIMIFLSSIVTLVILNSLFTPGMGPALDSGLHEKIAINNVFTNSTTNAVFLEVKSLNKNVTVESAIIRDDKGIDMAVVPLSVTIPEGQSATIRVNYNCTLSGYYWITLKTETGGNFISPLVAIGYVDQQEQIMVKEIIYDPNQSLILAKCNRIDDRTPFYVGITNSSGGVVLTGYRPVLTQFEDGTDLAIHQPLSSGQYKLYIIVTNSEKGTIKPFTIAEGIEQEKIEISAASYDSTQCEKR